MMIVNRKKTPKSSLSSLTLEEKCSVVILSLTENEILKNPKTFPCHASSVPPKIGNLFSSFVLLTTCLPFHCNMIWCSLSKLIMVIYFFIFLFLLLLFFLQVGGVFFHLKIKIVLSFQKTKLLSLFISFPTKMSPQKGLFSQDRNWSLFSFQSPPRDLPISNLLVCRIL